MVALFCMDSSQNYLSLSFSTPTPASCTHTHAHAHTRAHAVIQHTRSIGRLPGQLATPLQVPPAGLSFYDPIWPRMSRQLTQRPNPDLPAGTGPQFGSCTQPAGSLTGTQLNSMAGLKSLLQHPMKGDQRLKPPCDAKGEPLSSVMN